MAVFKSAIMQEKKCKECGKEFLVPNTTSWAYKITIRPGSCIWFDSWGCMCRWRKKHEKPVKLKGGEEYAV